MAIELEKWGEIRDQFKDNLLLGNGASIAVDDRLSYPSLYQQVRKSGNLESELINVFGEFKTSNFEFILRLLLEANRVNNALGIKEQKTKIYYHELRDALIKTIGLIHPRYDEITNVLESMHVFLKNFKKVLSLNYDLLVYWAMLAGNEKYKVQWFKDCFLDGHFERDFRYLEAPHGTAKGSTLVFYPHGSLFLASDIYGEEIKLSRVNDDRLLETITERWMEKDYIPLFVSEGTNTEKIHAIGRSGYLGSVYDNVLSGIRDSLAIYGWSISDQDDHILKALDHKGITDIAFSVFKGNKEWPSHCDAVKEKVSQTRFLKDAKLRFFDSQSEGCWIN